MSSSKKHANGSSGVGAAATKLIALVVAESFPASRGCAGSLYPMVPAVPMALVRVCDVAVIDYVLESLVQNGVDTVFVLLNKSSYTPVVEHMQTVRSARGKAWLDCREMKVSAVESTRVMTCLFDAVEEVKHQNLIPEGRTVVWMPIDCLTNLSNLKEMFVRHEQRAEEVPKYAATMIACHYPWPLRMAFEAAVNENCKFAQRDDDSVMDHAPTTPVTAQVSPGVFVAPRVTEFEPHRSAVDFPRMVIAYDPATGVVQQLQRCESTFGHARANRDEDDNEGGDDADLYDDASSMEPIRIEFSRKSRICVRTDLVFFGACLIAPGGLSLFEHTTNVMTDLFTRMIDNQETEGNSFAVEVCPPNTSILSLRSVAGYLFAQWGVMNRLLFPLTRESNFADHRAHYAVSHGSPTVYVDESAHGASALARVSDNVVVGSGTVIPAGCRVRRSVVGNHVSIGKDCVIEGSVVHDGVTLGDGVILRDCVVCSGARIGGGVDLCNNSVVGSAVVIASSHTSLCLDGVRVELCQPSDSDALVVGNAGIGRSCCELAPASALAPVALFVCDNLPVDPSNDEDLNQDESEQFYQAVQSLVDVGIRWPSKIRDTLTLDMRNMRLTYGKTNADLVKIVIQLLLKSASKTALGNHPGSSSASAVAEAFQIACDLISHWCCFFVGFVVGSREMGALLEGMCIAIRDPSCPLHTKAPKLLEYLYNACDDELYDSRGYCIVSGEALVSFDDHVADLEADDPATLDEEEKAILLIGTKCVKYIEGVAAYLEEERAQAGGA